MLAIIVFYYFFKGPPGDKGQRGEVGNPGFDVLSAVKVRNYFF